MGNSTNENRPVSPVNGQPLPRGKPFEPGERAREIGRRGGKRSKAVQAERKTLREELLILLTAKVPSKDGKKIAAQEAMSTEIIRQAIKGNTKAFEIIRDTIGEKPMESVKITTSDFSALDDAFSKMSGDEK